MFIFCSCLWSPPQYGNFVDNLRLYVRGGSGGMGLPRLGGQGGKGGDVWVVATKNMTLKRIKDKHPQKRFAGGAGGNSRFVTTHSSCSSILHVVSRCQPLMSCVFYSSSVSVHWKERWEKTQRSWHQLESQLLLMKEKYLVCPTLYNTRSISDRGISLYRYPWKHSAHAYCEVDLVSQSFFFLPPLF